MHQYNFIKPGINKVYAFVPYLQTNFPLYNNLSYTDPDLYIHTTSDLTPEQLLQLQAVIENYVDPEVFLVLSSSMTDPYRSIATSSSTPVSILTFIMSCNDPNHGMLNSFKTVMEYSTTDVSLLESGPTNCTMTFELYNQSSNVLLNSVTVDVSDIIQSWQTMAQNQETGPRSVFRSFMIEGIRHYLDQTSDCIWQFKVGISNTNVSVVSHSVQSLYYNVL